MSTSTASTSPSTVTVSGLNSTTTKEVLEHFFSFCGKIDTIDLETNQAKIKFVKESAAKTALMLNGGTLEGSTISVSSDHIETPDVAKAQPPVASTTSSTEEHEVEQEDKPHAAIAAEFIAAGYHLSDSVIQRAIATDHQFGISSRFLSFFNPVATKVQTTAQPHLDKVADKINQVDASQGISLKAQAAAIIGTKYYNAALSSPFGSKVHAFYTTTTKQVLDVHEEALRIKESKQAAAAATSAATSTGATPAVATSTGVHEATTGEKAPLV